MDEAFRIKSAMEAAGFKIDVVGNNGHFFMFAARGQEKAAVRGDDYLRVIRALAIAVAFSCDVVDPPAGDNEMSTPP
jgi:hypothetical protein